MKTVHHTSDTKFSDCGVLLNGWPDFVLGDCWDDVTCEECLQAKLDKLNSELVQIAEFHKLMVDGLGLRDPYYESWRKEQTGKRLKQIAIIQDRKKGEG